ncbi:MAG: tyrosine-type recombinase/integrase [Phycisphaerae bacterium]|jgi:integrase|nr:tyrosine-type recombinase/integrase [Phycisphaerae bacterium]
MASKNPTGVWIETRKGVRGNTYRVRWKDPVSGKNMSMACGRDKAFARDKCREIRERLRNKLSGKIPEVTIEELTEQLSVLMAGKHEDTIKKTKASLSLLEKWCNVRLISHIGRRAIMDFRAMRLEEKKKPATVNKDLRQIRSALSYAVDAGLLEKNPLLGWKGLALKVPEKVVRIIEKDEFAELLTQCKNPDYRALLIVGYRQGLRRQELCNLRWKSVDVAKQVIHVVNIPEESEFTKSRKNRHVPMHPQVHTLLVEMQAKKPKVVQDGRVVHKSPYVFTWLDGRPFKPDWVTHEFARLRKRTTIAHCTFHDLRRSFGTHALRAGVDKSIVMRLGGWLVARVLDDYYTGDMSELLRKEMDKIAEAG